MRIKAIALSAAVISAVGRLSALFAAPTLVYPAENAEVKTVGDKIWDEIHNDAVYLKQATFYQETYNSAYRQSAMREVSTNSLPIVFRWSGTSGACTVKAWRTRDLAADQSAAPVFAATTTGTSVTYWDPEVGRDFTWTVEDSAGRATGHFHTAQRAPRIIYADHDPDAAGAACTAGRDLGGWLTADGTKKVRQGLVYRSAALEYCSPGESEDLYKPLDYLQDTLGIRLDLDLRTVAHLEKYWIGAKGWNCEWKNGAKLTITESNIGPLVERYCVDSDYAEFPSYAGFTSSVANKKAVWAAFGKIYNSVVVKGEPVIFHCSHGKDRTGSLAYVLLGALGVSELDARRDFGFTWYLEAKNDTYMGTDGTDGYDGLTLLLNALPSGETFQARCVAYLAACGSAAADSGAAAKIAAFQSAMLEDAEDPGSGGGSSGEPVHDDTGTVDVAASTYTWCGYTGPWEQPTNWTASASGTYGVPAHGTYATADFPATLDGAFACTLGESLAVDKVEFNSPNMTFVVDSARLDVNGKVDDYAAYDFGDGEYDNATIELKGPGAMIVSSAARTRANFGCRHDGFTPKGVCTVRFVVPAAGWESEPRIKAVGVDSKVVFYSNSRLEIDATALGVPEEGETKSVLLASGTGDNGVYVGSMATNIVCAAGAKGAIKVESQMLVLEVVADSTFQPEEPSSDIKAEWGYVKRGLGAFGNEVAVVFTNDTAEAMTWTVPADLTNVQFLVVGGGGGGGGDNCASDGCVGGGGGGGGGVVTGLVYSIAKDAVVTVSVGAGGAGGKAGTKPGTSSYDNYGAGKIGLNSSFAVGGITYVTAKGGGRDLGVSKTISSGTRYQGGQGGSSAGSRAKKTTQGDATQGEIGSGAANLLEAVLFGNKGGAGDSTIEYASAGGGGATESGHSPESSSQGGKGGEGLLLEITGTAEVYGSGGGGGTALTAGVGGAGGTNAGDGHRTGKANGENGVANRGGGGGGGGGQANGGAGGSGIVVFRYVEQILPRVGDDEAGVEIDKVFDVARVSKPIVYPSRPVLRDEDGQQQIVFGGRAVDVPTYYTAALAETAGGFEVSLQLNDRARPVIADGEGDEAPAKALVIEDGVVKIHLENVHSGLYYRLERSTEIGDGADWSEVSEWQRAGEFSSPLGSDPAAFYKVIVSDEPPTGD